SRPRTSSVPLSFFVLLSFSLPPFILLSSLLTPRPPISTLFPYTTLFRSSVQTGSLDGGGHFAFIECVTVFWGGDHWRRGSDGHVSGDLCRLFTVTLLARNEFVLTVAQVDSDRPFTINNGSRVNFLTVHLKGDGGVVQTSTGDLGDRLVDDVAILRRGEGRRSDRDLDGGDRLRVV